LTTGINDTGKFATGVNDTGGKFAAGINDTAPRIFEKIQNGPNGILRGWGETD
jgi:hypothetical protein